MEKIELTKEQINYIATYIEEESGYDMGTVLLSIENAIEAYNGGAR